MAERESEATVEKGYGAENGKPLSFDDTLDTVRSWTSVMSAEYALTVLKSQTDEAPAVPDGLKLLIFQEYQLPITSSRNAKWYDKSLQPAEVHP